MSTFPSEAGLGNDTSQNCFLRDASKTHVFYVVFYTQDVTCVECMSQTYFCVNKEHHWLFLTKKCYDRLPLLREGFQIIEEIEHARIIEYDR